MDKVNLNDLSITSYLVDRIKICNAFTANFSRHIGIVDARGLSNINGLLS